VLELNVILSAHLSIVYIAAMDTADARALFGTHEQRTFTLSARPVVSRPLGHS